VDTEEGGSKQTFKQVKETMKELGIDVEGIWMQINDLVIKTIISIDSITNSCMDMYVPNSENCFDLIGFDILIDENLKPWLLEVNMSPSLACESQLDIQVKVPLISDLFNLICIPNKAPRKKPNKSSRHTFS